MGNDVDTRDKLDSTPLMEAAKWGRDDEVVALIARGADVNAVERNNWDVLLCAVHGEKEPTALLLIDKGANVKYVTPGGYTALMQACQRHLHRVIDVMVEKGAPIDQQDTSSGITALMVAIGGRDVKAACMLIHAGANDTLPDKQGRTAHEWAAEKLTKVERSEFLNALQERRDARAAEKARVVEKSLTLENPLPVRRALKLKAPAPR